jgi:hypothetical protein
MKPSRPFYFDCAKDLRNHTFEISPHIALPNPDNSPTEPTESSRNCSITAPIAFNLRDPVFAVPASRQSLLPH